MRKAYTRMRNMFHKQAGRGRDRNLAGLGRQTEEINLKNQSKIVLAFKVFHVSSHFKLPTAPITCRTLIDEALQPSICNALPTFRRGMQMRVHENGELPLPRKMRKLFDHNIDARNTANSLMKRRAGRGEEAKPSCVRGA